jgi:UrcA family protein
MIKSSVTTLALALALGSPLAAGVAVASPSLETYSRTVRLSDLNLSSERGAEVALRRIRSAARYVCGDPMSTRHAQWTSLPYRACVQQASDNAIRDLGNATVTARYNGGKPVRIARK